VIAAWALLALLAADGGTEDGGIRLRAVGDVMLGTADPEGHLPPDDGAHLLDDVRDWLQDSDATFANLEGPLCDSGASSKCRGKAPGRCFAFRTPTRYAAYLADAHLTLASTANNHAGDFGEECRRQTEKVLDGIGIAWSGPPGTMGTATVRGRSVVLVSFHASTGTNDVNDLAAARALVKRAKQAHDFVVVSFHGGAEGTRATHVVKGVERFFGENRGDVIAFAHAVIDAGADLVLGSGPHVLRALELYRGRLIAYSLGNFATYGRFELSGVQHVGAILEVELGPDGRFAGGRILSTVQEGLGVPKKDPAMQAVRLIRELTAADFPKTGIAPEPDGTLRASPKMGTE
jgi:poly-gamma-glutamate capsule biosynthesis protein CapA/YwtB (metallophosphatase superfamily)